MDLIAISNLPWDTAFRVGGGPELDPVDRTHVDRAGAVETWLAGAATRAVEAEGVGGAPTNVALAWAGLGGRASVIGPVAGDEHGARVRADLTRHGVALFELTPAPLRQAHSLAFARSGGERLFLATLPELPAPVRCDFTGWGGPGWLATSAYELHDAAMADLVMDSFERAAAAGRRLVVDLADPNFVRRRRPDLLRLVGLGLEVMLAGDDSLAVLLEQSPGRPVDASVARRLAGTLLITRGAAGARLVTGDLDRQFPTESVTPVDTTGAGDAFLGAFLMARSRGRNDEAAVRFAHTAAAAAVAVAGAHLPDDEWRTLSLRLGPAAD